MIKTETITIRGRQMARTYSDAGMMIERDGVRYDAAIDPAGSGRTYTETDEPVSTAPSGRLIQPRGTCNIVQSGTGADAAAAVRCVRRVQ